ncbi:hypothetical protein HQN89_28225 [Paenibacillus frigoriresistens]|uniref:hypothetical protein n=1 Tax=Paenibacillus alginolyticus TaxID=59839 RepID=UPI0015668340|nr:hypothetical protein [Paenibacillus frigoriresistens]NRF94785.1 hypothetical protein [Paenibacillus frigoriresistens]
MGWHLDWSHYVIACLAHFRVKDPISKTAAAIVFTALIIILTIINADGLMLPLF